MKKFYNINNDWKFFLEKRDCEIVNIPHTWNNVDGQDGGNDYLRTLARYEKEFECPSFDKEKEDVYIEFDGVNSECDVYLNSNKVIRHEGGYSTFRANITALLTEGTNLLKVNVDNRPNTKVYPQKADFTFYGGIYRDVRLIVVNKERFDLDHFGGRGLQVTARPIEGYKKADVHVNMWLNTNKGDVKVTIYDAQGKEIITQTAGRAITEAWLDTCIQEVNLWDGIDSPYLYSLKA